MQLLAGLNTGRDVKFIENQNSSQFKCENHDDKTKLIHVFPGKVSIGKNLDSLSAYKVETGLALALRLTGKYELTPRNIKDSLFYAHKDDSFTIAQFALLVNATEVAFVNINRIHNMMRTEITLKNLVNDSTRWGEGYSLLRFKKGFSGEPLYDPSILESLQRAVAVSIGDTNIYSGLSKELEVKPLPTLVIGGLYFKDNEQNSGWELFKDKMLNSYDAVETMFDEVVKHDIYVVYDSETRDSIFALYNLYEAENYFIPSELEIEALSNFGVEYYLTGVFEKIDSGADINLVLCEIRNKRLLPVYVAKGSIISDDLIEYRQEIKRLVGKLVEQMN